LIIALFHFHATQVKRSAGQSVVATAAYRAGEKLYSDYYGEVADYTCKGGVVCSEILLPAHAPPEYADRQTLWNAVEKIERGKKAQLAYSFDIALQNEFSLEENIALARQFVSEQLVSRGMVVDFAVHQPDKEDGGISNPHFHVLCPIRPIQVDGKWGQKQRRVYRLDENGNRLLGEDGKPLFKSAELRSKFKVPTPKDVVRKILLSGEITAVYTEIAKLSGFGDGAVKEVKN